MRIYTIKDDKTATDILLLIKVNTECARLHWSCSIKDIPSNVMNALETIEGYVESKIVDLCGKEKSELTDDEEKVVLSVVKKNRELQETLGTGVVMKGSQAAAVTSIIKTQKGMDKISEALESGENVIIF